MAITSTGLISGLDVESLIAQVQASQRRPIVILETRQASIQEEIGAVLSLSSKLSTFKAVATSVDNPANFNTKLATVTETTAGTSLLTASADSTAVTGSHVLLVKQLAQAHKLGSQGIVDQNTTAVASANGTFKFKVGSAGTEHSVAVTSSTTVEELRDAINAVGGSITASIINDGTGSNPYRLILTAKESGSGNQITVTNNDTTLDFTNKKVEDAFALTTNSFSGTVSSNSGNNYTGTTNKTFLVKIVGAGAAGVATYKYSIDGGITYLGSSGAAYDGSNAITSQGTLTNFIDGSATSNSSNEGVQVAFGAGTLAVEDTFTVDVFNPSFQSATDSVITVDNLTFTKDSNSITDVIQGVTLDLVQVDSSNSVTLKISSDASGVTPKIVNFVNAFNEVNTFLNQQLSFDPEGEAAGALLGDATLRSVQVLVKNIISGRIPGLTSGKTNLSQIGITSNGLTGALIVDEGKLSAAISDDPDGVRRLFLGIGTPSNSAVEFVGLTSKTGAGTYGISISAAPQKAIVGGASNAAFQDLSSTGLTDAELVSFTFSSDFTADSPTTTAFSVTLSAGSKINTVVNTLNSAFTTQGVGLSASNDSGRLKITSTDFGNDIRFTVVTDQGGTVQTGIGTVGLTAQGVDIAGTINAHSATGIGNILTSKSGFAEDGLSISTESTTTGLFGTITVTLGVGNQLVNSLDTFTNSTTGILIGKTDSLQGSIDRISTDIERINERITKEGDRLRQQLLRLEPILGQFQATSTFLATQLSKLPSFNIVRRT